MSRPKIGHPGKTLLFKPGAIGDVLWTTPFVRYLRKAFPGSQITYCVGRSAKAVLENNPNIDRIVEADDAKLMKKDLVYSLSLALLLRKEKFDIAFAFEKHRLSNLFVRSTGIPVRVGFDRFGEGFGLSIRVPYGRRKHEIKYYLDLLAALDGKGPFDTDSSYEEFFGPGWHRTEVFPKAEEREAVGRIFHEKGIAGHVAGICPGGGVNVGQDTPFRRWPLEKFTRLSRELAGRGYAVVLFGGPSDAGLAAAFDAGSVNLIGALNVRETIVAMGKCTHVICNDAGPMNMAAAADPRPVIVSLFGPTDPARKAPPGEKSIPIWKDEDIYDPGYDLYGRIGKTTGFMERIAVEDVLEKVLQSPVGAE